MSGIALFEDQHWQNFSPITLTKATFDVKLGAKSFFEEYNHEKAPEILLTRRYLAKVTEERHSQCKVNPDSIDTDTIFVNGLLHPGTVDLDRLLKAASHTFAIIATTRAAVATTSSGKESERTRRRLLVARLDKKGIEYLKECTEQGKIIDVKRFNVAKLIQIEAEQDDDIQQGLLSEPWQIIKVLDNSLGTQVISAYGKDDNNDNSHVSLGSSSHTKVIGIGRVVVGNGAEIEDGTVFDTRKGGIYIGHGAHISPSRIVGPAYIDGLTQVKQFSIIDTSYIGYNCRVAGEVEHSVISSHTNKAHDGFVGHSYIGEWVNIGAMTTTSDLKMTYGNIKMNNIIITTTSTTASGNGNSNNSTSIGASRVDTGLNKVGSFFGDMCKTSIGTLIYSGRRIGVSSHLHGLVAQDVPSFTIFGSSIGAKNVELQLDSALETQRKMMSRRNQTMSSAYEQMIKDIFAMTADERKSSNVRKGRFEL